MIVTLQFRRDSGAAWDATNPVLAAGEPGYDLDSRTLKIGDGVTPWRDLPTAGGGTSTSTEPAGWLLADGAGHVITAALDQWLTVSIPDGPAPEPSWTVLADGIGNAIAGAEDQFLTPA